MINLVFSGLKISNAKCEFAGIGVKKRVSSFAARFLKCVLPFWDMMYERVKMALCGMEWIDLTDGVIKISSIFLQ